MTTSEKDRKMIARGFALLLIGAVSVALSLFRDLGHYALLLAVLMVSLILLGRYFLDKGWR